MPKQKNARNKCHTAKRHDPLTNSIHPYQEVESNDSISMSYEYELCLIWYNAAIILDNLTFFLLLGFYFENLLIYNFPSNFCHIKLSITKLYRIHSSLYKIRSKMSWIGNKLYRNIQLGPLNVQESIHIVQDYSYLQGSSLGQSSRIFANQKGHLLSIL